MNLRNVEKEHRVNYLVFCKWFVDDFPIPVTTYDRMSQEPLDWEITSLLISLRLNVVLY